MSGPGLRWAVALAAGVLLLPARAGAAEPGAVDRVLVLSVPHVTWSDLGHGDTPRLDALLDRSAIANLAVRGVRRRTTLGEGYATFSAGTRAGAPRFVDGLSFHPDETFEGVTAGEAFARRTGRPAEGAAALNLSVDAYHERNERLLFGGEVGALGAALAAGGVSVAVIANADRDPAVPEPIDYGRQAVTALMGPEGTLARGRVDAGLLRPETVAPWGRRLDPEAVAAAFDAVWQDRSVVLVEASDLARADAAAELAPPGVHLRTQLMRDALRWTDQLAGAILSRVDMERHAVLVVGPSSPQNQARLTVAAVSVPGQAPALLRSASTRRSGFVVLADVAPTILELVGVERPTSMEGRPMGTGDRHGDAGDRRGFLIDTEAEARFRDQHVTPVALSFVGAQGVLAALAILVLGRRPPSRWRTVMEVGALWLLLTLPLTYLAGLFWFSDLGTSAYAAFVGGGSLVLALGARFLRRIDGRDGLGDILPVGVALAVMLAVIAGSAMTGSSLQLNTVFGDSPIVAGRFSGINNVTFAQLVTATLLLCALGFNRLAGRRRTVFVLGLLGAVLVVDGLPAFGADVGGVLAAAPAFVLVGGRLLGGRIGARTVVAAALGTVLALAAFVLFDLARPPDERSHLGRLVEQIDANGWGAFSQVVARKADANVSVITRSPWTPMVPAALAYVAFLVYRSPSTLAAIIRRLPQLRVALTGVGVAGVLGFALNDSGIAVPGMMLAVLNPVLIYLSARWT